MKDGGKPGEMSYEQVEAFKDIKDMSDVERRERDVCAFSPSNSVIVTDFFHLPMQAKEFSSSPPGALSQAQKTRWAELFTGKFFGFFVVIVVGLYILFLFFGNLLIRSL